MLANILNTDNSRVTILVRLMVGSVFVSEGIQKFLFPDALGTGRFVKIGLPFPDILAPFTAAFEISAGTFVMLGLFTRLAAIPLLMIMLVAITTTKIPILLHDGFWKMFHESRTDWSMLLGTIFLLLTGGGRWSLDSKFFRNV